ncbi:hypothetical protein MPER_04843 [Moniliophthora perniciosa FA553]|nr:hypothetical protein MPER_04843 [Moniliophthora perniciosa FA553]
MEEELTEARKKMKDDEEAISMLRSKVEESRQSMQPIDVARASIPLLGSPPSSKRASFTPLTGTYNTRANGHKRGASVTPVTPKDTSSFELESIKKELTSIKVELEDTRHELSEAIEARGGPSKAV